MSSESPTWGRTGGDLVDAGIEYISQERPFQPTKSFIGIQKTKSQKQQILKAADLSPLLSPLY
jgi:hypothetical protein